MVGQRVQTRLKYFLSYNNDKLKIIIGAFVLLASYPTERRISGYYNTIYESYPQVVVWLIYDKTMSVYSFYDYKTVYLNRYRKKTVDPIIVLKKYSRAYSKWNVGLHKIHVLYKSFDMSDRYYRK